MINITNNHKKIEFGQLETGEYFTDGEKKSVFLKIKQIDLSGGPYNCLEIYPSIKDVNCHPYRNVKSDFGVYLLDIIEISVKIV